jgi:hypothetical protein
MQPTGVDVLISYGLKRCAVSGAQPVVAEDLRGTMQLALTDIDLNSPSPRKVAARVALTQALDLGRVAVEGKLAVTALHENVTTHIQAKESGAIEVALPQLKVAIAGLQATVGEKQLGPLPLSALVTAAGVRLGAAKGARPMVEHATCTLTGGDFLRLSARAALTDGAPQRAVSEGSVNVDLGRLLPLAAPLLPAGAAAAGMASVTWSVAAPTVPAPLPHTDNPLVRARAALGMIDRAELRIALDSRDLRWPLPGGDVSLADMHTGQPLRVVVPGDKGPLTLGGDIAFAGLGGSAAVAEKLPVQSGALSLQGELAGWRSLKLRETFRAEPFGLVQNVEATVGGIDKLLEQQGAVTASALLRQLDARATADVAARFPAAPTPVAGGAELSGASRAHLGLVLEGGRDLQVQASARTQNFGVGLASGTTVEGLNADLRFERR